MEDLDNGKMHTADRIIILSPIDGKALTTDGMVDTRLFKGENRLHALMDTQTCLWSLRYDSGSVPYPLKQRFTSFNKVLKAVKEYFGRRNVEVKEVIG